MAVFQPICLPLSLGLVLTLTTSCQRGGNEGDARAETKRLFDSVCAKCHGSDGRGGVPSAEGQPAPRNFTDPAFHARRSDADLKNVIENGRGPMPPFGRLLNESQTTALVGYIRAFNTKK